MVDCPYIDLLQDVVVDCISLTFCYESEPSTLLTCTISYFISECQEK